MNAYAVSLSKYVNTGILALFTLLSYLGLMTRPGRMRRAIEIIQRILLAGFLINANMTIAWLAEGSASRMLLILCAMEILFMLSFMVLYRIVHEMANMMLFNNICMLLSICFVTISRIAFYGNMEDIEYGSGEPIKQFVKPVDIECCPSRQQFLYNVFFFLELLQGFFEHLVLLVLRHHHNTIAITKNDIARANCNAAAYDR